MIRQIVTALLLALAFSGAAEAKKYKPINEIPGQVPATDEEKGVWQVGLALRLFKANFTT